MYVSSLGRYFAVVGVLISLQALPVVAQQAPGPVFQMPELLGQVDSVSVSPAEIVIGGKRFAVAKRVMLTRNGVNEFASFVEIATLLGGQSIAYGLIGVGGDRLIVDRILLLDETLQGDDASDGRGGMR